MGGSGYAMRWYVLTNPVTQPAMLLLVSVASHMPNCTDGCHKLATHMLRYSVHGVAAGCRRSNKRYRWGCRRTRLGCVWYPCAELQPTCITPRQPAVARLHTTGHTHARTHAHTRTDIDVARARVHREREMRCTRHKTLTTRVYTCTTSCIADGTHMLRARDKHT